jgi:hypothetical protein
MKKHLPQRTQRKEKNTENTEKKNCVLVNKIKKRERINV